MTDPGALTVFLLRHARHGLLGRTLCGRMAGVSLDPTGRTEAAALAARFDGEPVAAILSSPLERAVETAAPIAVRLGLDLRIDPALNEIDFGEWTGRDFDALRDDGRWHSWNRDRENGCPPGGEPMRDTRARVAAALEACRRTYPGRAVVAVSHADVIKAGVCGVLGLSVDRYGAFEIDPASITTLVLWNGGGKVLSLNQHAPLPPDAFREAA